MPAWLRALASAAMVEMSMTLTMGHSTILHTTPDVQGLVNKLHTQHMTAQRLSGYEIILCSNAQLQIKYGHSSQGPAPFLNALLLLKGEQDEVPEPHDCIHSIDVETSP